MNELFGDIVCSVTVNDIVGSTNFPTLGKRIYFGENVFLSKNKINSMRVITQNDALGQISNGRVQPTLNIDVHSKYTISIAKYDINNYDKDGKLIHEPKYLIFNYSLASFSDSVRRGIMAQFEDTYVDMGCSFIVPRISGLWATPGTFFLQLFLSK